MDKARPYSPQKVIPPVNIRRVLSPNNFVQHIPSPPLNNSFISHPHTGAKIL